MTLGTRLGDLFRVGSSKRVLKSQWQSEGIPFYRGREVSRLAINGYLENELFISESLYDALSGQHGVPVADDILITAVGTIGNSYVVRTEDKFYFKDASVLWLKKTADVSSQFINYWLKSDQFLGQLDRGNGATVDTLTIQKLQSVRLGLPSQPEQHRIVHFLDQAFDAISTAQANAEDNLRHTRELGAGELESLFRAGAARWPERPLQQVAHIINGYAFKSGDFQSTAGVRSIKITNVGVREFVADSGNFLPITLADRHAGLAVAQGSIVMALTRTLIAAGLKVAVVPTEFDGALLNQRVAAIQPHCAQLEPAFLMAYLSTRRVTDYVKARVNTLMQPNLSIADLRALPIPLPALVEQRSALAKLHSLGEQTQRLESIHRRKLAALDELKKSLLQQAFSGAL